MPTMKFLVEVEVERESGKFAPRDEMSDAIATELESAPEGANLSGIGADGTSEYHVASVSITEMDDKALRAAWKDNEQFVVAELPGDAELRAKVRLLKRQLRESEKAVDRLQEKLDDARKERAGEPTAVWYSPDGLSRDGSNRIFIPDGRYDGVLFQFGDSLHDTIRVTKQDSELEVRLEGMGLGQMVVAPTAGNSLRIFMVEK